MDTSKKNPVYSRTDSSKLNISDEEWRNHFRQHYEGQDLDYDYFAPAYRYGAEMGRNDRYRGRQYDDIESDLRRDYETRYPGSAWDRIKDAVRHGWEKVTGQTWCYTLSKYDAAARPDLDLLEDR